MARVDEEYDAFKRVALIDFEPITDFIENKYFTVADNYTLDSLIFPGTNTTERNLEYASIEEESLTSRGKRPIRRSGGCLEGSTKLMRLEYKNPNNKFEIIDHKKPLSSIEDIENIVWNERPISEILETMWVLSSTLEVLKDHPRYQMNCWSRVEAAWEGDLHYSNRENFLEVEYESNGEKYSFKLTPDHKVYAKIGVNWDWVAAGDLTIGTKLYSGKRGGIRSDSNNKGRVLEITNIKPADIPTKPVKVPVYGPEYKVEISGYETVQRPIESTKLYTLTTEKTLIFLIGATEDTNIVIHNKIVVSALFDFLMLNRRFS